MAHLLNPISNYASSTTICLTELWIPEALGNWPLVVFSPGIGALSNNPTPRNVNHVATNTRHLSWRTVTVRLQENIRLDHRVPVSRHLRSYEFSKTEVLPVFSLVLEQGNSLDLRQYFLLCWHLVLLHKSEPFWASVVGMLCYTHRLILQNSFVRCFIETTEHPPCEPHACQRPPSCTISSITQLSLISCVGLIKVPHQVTRASWASIPYTGRRAENMSLSGCHANQHETTALQGIEVRTGHSLVPSIRTSPPV